MSETHQVYSTLKRLGNDLFHVVSTWSARGEIVGFKIGLNGLMIDPIVPSVL